MNAQNDTDNNKEIAELIFGNVAISAQQYLEKYPARDLPPGTIVTRFSPSPTGFVHIGSLFSAMISERFSHQSKGVFYLRVEDTDKKREVENGVKGITDAMSKFSIMIDEGAKDDKTEIGKYGPYKQSDRKDIYWSFMKQLVEMGHAYPCFCTPEELEAARKTQETEKIRPGYYGKWAKHRDITIDDIKKNLSEGKTFVLRLRSNGKESNKIPFTDLIKGEVSVTENDQDVVLIKSDKLPTYHFAHVVDDYLMKTTHVLRGDEWLSSLPIHLQIFEMFSWTAPLYGHISPILKTENGNKRKISKRKDPEAAVEYYLKEGYPINSVIEYLLNIANSDFEDWRKANPDLPNTDYNIKLEKLSKSGALFDINKLADISKNIIAKMSAAEVYENVLKWALENDPDFAKKLTENKEYFLKIFAIERNGDNPRKDFSKWSDVKGSIFYFFKDMYEEYTSKEPAIYPKTIEKETVKNIIVSYSQFYYDKFHTDRASYSASNGASKEDWFAALKDFAMKNGFVQDAKSYKQDPRAFKGHVGDVAMILRIALTSKTKTPDLYEILQVMGIDLVLERLRFSANVIK